MVTSLEQNNHTMAVRGNSRGWSKDQSAAAPHSRFIPEAERGWRDWAGDRGSPASVASPAGKLSTGITSASMRRSSSFLPFSSLWNSPRVKSKTLPDEHDEVAVDDDDDDDDDEQQLARGHGRERSNSMPTSPMSDDARSYFTAGDNLDRTHSNSSTIKRKSLQLPPDHHEMLTPEQFDEAPDTLSRHSSATRSLPRTQSPTTANPTRGYAWHKDGAGDGSYIHPAHRNPTGKQAFYDTHFGSSSGWRSVAGMADDVFHPLEHAKLALGRLGGAKKEKKSKEAGGEASSKPAAERKRESMLSWSVINSLGTFGLTASDGGQGKPSTVENGGPGTLRAYEPELIPTIQREPHANRYFKSLTGNVVVLGGYRGSILRDAETQQMMWVPLKVGVGLRRPTLELGLTREAEERSEEHVVADEMLGGIGSLVDMGKRLIQRCSSKRTRVHSWGYDWRLSLGRSSERLEAFLLDLWTQSAERDQDRRGAKVVAHSMGGLVALHALVRTRRPEIFDSLVFASTPFLGTANILGPFRFGDAALFNDEICSPRATFSFRSSFYLLPTDSSDERQEDTSGGRCFEEEDGTPHDLDFLDAETWNDIGFSPCVERGKRQEVLAKSRMRASKEGLTLGETLQRSASLRESRSGPHDDGKDDEQTRATGVPSFPGPDIQMVPSKGNEEHSSALDRAGGGLVDAALAGQSAFSVDEQSTMQHANRQETARREASTLSQDEWEEIMEDEASAAWLYLEDTLAETRRFFHELRNGFRDDYFVQQRYPPMAILTSGRTPTVRGALVAHTSSPDQAGDKWKEGARQGDYSRMLYAPGDGVILRRSATSLPGRWGELLVRGQQDDKDALTSVEGVVETSHRHVTLLSDVDGVGRCLEACRLAKNSRRG